VSHERPLTRLQRTHLEIDPELVGEPVELVDGRATVRLRLGRRMAADDRGLVHGGFIFGLADYAAMLAVNDPNVVLAGSSCRFLRPSIVGDELVASAERTEIEGRKSTVVVTVRRDDETLYEGEFRCYTPERHVLD